MPASLQPTPSRRLAFGAVLLLASAGAAMLWRGRPHAAATGGGHASTGTRGGTRPAARPLDGKIRIGLRSISGGSRLGVKPTAAGAILDGSTGRKLAALTSAGVVSLSADFTAGEVIARTPRGSVRGKELILAGGLLDIGRRHYPGRLHVSLAGTGLQLIDELEIEQYLQGVLPGELPLGYHPEAQKALAVAARTYALVERGKHGAYDLCDGTDCQMFVGYLPKARRGLAAVKATRHLCLWDGPRLVYAFYSADCGGLSTRADEVPLKDKPAEPLPYLRVVRDAPPHGADFCAASPYHHWVRQLTREQVEERLNRDPETYVGKLRDLKVTGNDPSNRITAVRLRGEADPQLAMAALGLTPPASGPVEKTVTGWELRRALGGLTLKSTRVTVDQPTAHTYRFTGTGFGHGLGLCQIGANGMARQGYRFRQILAHYYPGTRLAPLPG